MPMPSIMVPHSGQAPSRIRFRRTKAQARLAADLAGPAQGLDRCRWMIVHPVGGVVLAEVPGDGGVETG
jgi:hypothetical protein